MLNITSFAVLYNVGK